MRIVLDTNILVAAARSSRGTSYHLLKLVPDSRFQMCILLPLYFEYLDVLNRQEIRPADLSADQIAGTVRYLVSQAHLQEIYFHWRPFLPDSGDDMSLELAVAAGASHIVTFNLKDFRGIEAFGLTVLKPRDFLIKVEATKFLEIEGWATSEKPADLFLKTFEKSLRLERFNDYSNSPTAR